MFCKDCLEDPSREQILKMMTLDKYPCIYISDNGRKVDVTPKHLTEKEVGELQIADRSFARHKKYQKLWKSKTGHIKPF